MLLNERKILGTEVLERRAIKSHSTSFSVVNSFIVCCKWCCTVIILVWLQSCVIFIHIVLERLFIGKTFIATCRGALVLLFTFVKTWVFLMSLHVIFLCERLFANIVKEFVSTFEDPPSADTSLNQLLSWSDWSNLPEFVNYLMRTVLLQLLLGLVLLG